MKNDFEIRGDVTAIFINSPKYGTKEVLISTNKLKRAQEIGSWRVNWNQKAKAFYVQRHIPFCHRKYNVPRRVAMVNIKAYNFIDG